MKIDGKPVKDTKRRVVLTITERDVARGKSKQPDACAAAKACVRQLGALSARVYTSRTYVEFPRHWERFHTPSNLRTEIISFDRGHAFEPGDYTLRPMQKSKVATGKRQGGPAPKGRSNFPRRYNKINGIRSHAAGWENEAA